MGRSAGNTITTGDHNTMLGYYTHGPTTGSHNVVIGDSMNIGNVSNTVAIYNGTVNASFSSNDTSWGFNSDGRDKTDIEDLTLGLDFLKRIQPRKFRWDFRDEKRFPVASKDNPDILIRSGFIAQEIQAVLADIGVKYTGLVDETNPDNLTVGQADFIPMIINAIKELSAKVTALEAK
tara:strand:+ start:9 stop:542 length:534 start_codon:yes stop_codon:yes gene_type:complete